ncbi:mandelate racemase/muconate lactonizing enzyme family protein (plasmid) [Roseivivax marinus]|uniref:mandelate racemase/muconate lactonizing enzyme family protein n=1 Tax=Roseivivax marinus TaxID=1379903 RepID=UPI001F036BA7|nr:mandelate racemase/muconate lactonizing enzyme family protein [Roseivivax marinus]UMA67088.1 mandelate racemase/muconate lactonizing enzyme family protein [Roseivivax marinus]
MSASKIDRVEARTIRVPLDKPTSFSTRQVHHRDYGIVRVTTSDGIQGIGFCYGGSDAGSLVSHAVRELFAPLVLGEDATRVEGLWDRMYSAGVLQGRAGAAMRGLSILDIALWDRNARAAQMPLHRFLGGYHDTTVPAYASGGYYLDGKTPDKLGEELAGYVAQGFKAVKMKVGRLGLAEEEARIRAAREAIGPDVELMLDANNAWRDLPTALRFMERYAPYNPYWIEEPFPVDDIDNHARLAQRTPIPVATGEIETGRWRFKELLDKEAAAILQTDAAVCGGISEYRRIGATAASYGVNLCPHWFHDLHIHLVGSAPNGQLVEYFPDDQVLNFRRLVDTQLEVRDGELVLPTTPGLGFAFDEAALDAYALDPWS